MANGLWYYFYMAFRFEQLDIWKDSSDYANKVYKITKTFPRSEFFGLISQLQRSASSISANIAEGSEAELLVKKIQSFKKWLRK